MLTAVKVRVRNFVEKFLFLRNTEVTAEVKLLPYVRQSRSILVRTYMYNVHISASPSHAYLQSAYKDSTRD
jgi:hypothetical protein